MRDEETEAFWFVLSLAAEHVIDVIWLVPSVPHKDASCERSK